MGVMYAVSVYGDSDRKESHVREDERTVSKEGGSKERKRKCVTIFDQ